MKKLSLEQLALLLDNPNVSWLPAVRVFVQERTRQAQQQAGSPVGLSAAAYILARDGNAEDVGLIWSAKVANLDTYAAIGARVVCGRDHAQAVVWLQQHEESLATFTINGVVQTAGAYMAKCLAGGDCDSPLEDEQWSAQEGLEDALAK